MATGDKLVNLDELKLVYDKLHVPSVQVQIPTGQWSGSSTRTYTVNATGVTADTIVDWAMDSSINYLTSDLTVTPGSGTITFSTPTLPAGTINVTLFFPGVNGEVVIQTLADVYSKSQVDQKISDAQRVYLRGTFSGNLLTGLKSLSPGVWYYKNSNVTTGAPQGANYGSYTIFVSEDRVASIYVAQQSAGIVAVANGIAIDTATTIPWTILQSTATLHIGGNMAGLARNDGRINIAVPYQGPVKTAVSANKTSNISGNIYGDKSLVGCTFTIQDLVISSQNVVYFNLLPSVTLSTYQNLGRVMMVDLSEAITLTLS